jgi:threonyl-tRNA synthetase
MPGREHSARTVRFAERLPYRAGIDDRDIKLGKKIHEAEKEWIPVRAGRRRAGVGRWRPHHPDEAGRQLEMSLDAFLDQLAALTAGKPQRPANTDGVRVAHLRRLSNT